MGLGFALWLVAVTLLVASTALSALDARTWLTELMAHLTLGAAVVSLAVAAVYSFRHRLLQLAQRTLNDVVRRSLDDLVQHRLDDVARRYLDTVVGTAIVRSMPPADVLRMVLQRIYPQRMDHQQLITWILGGAGRNTDYEDTVVSYDTLVEYRVEPVDDKRCTTHLRCRYRFDGVRNNHLLVIFATSSLQVARLIATERVYPLYELWILDEADLDAFVLAQQAKVQVGMRYKHEDGHTYVVEPTPLVGHEVRYQSYESYLRLPEGFDRNEIRMFVLDLHDLVDDHVVGVIDEVTLLSSNVANVDRGYLVWYPPHPCYVDVVSFDLEQLRDRGDRQLVYQAVTSGIGSAGMPERGWAPVGDTISVPVHGWMLPGHNVTLFYQPSAENGTSHGNDREGHR